MKDKYFFDHIPKTAGITILSLFEKFIGRDQIKSIKYYFNVSDVVKAHNKSRLISGHCYYLPGDALPSDRYNVTVLRHPIRKITSQYNFNQQHGVTKFKNINKFVEMMLDHTQPSSYTMLNNFQTNHFANLQGDIQNQDESTLLKWAQRTLEQFDLVGVTERLNHFVDMLCHDNHWSPIMEIPRENVSISRVDIPKELIKKIEEANSVDMALHEYTLQHVEKKYRHLIYSLLTYKEASTGVPAHKVAEENIISMPKETQFTLEKSSELNGNNSCTIKEIGNKKIEILNVQLVGHISGLNFICSGEMATIIVRFRAHEPTEKLIIGLEITDHNNQMISGINSFNEGYRLLIQEPGDYSFYFMVRIDFGIGNYSIAVGLHPNFEMLDGCYHYKKNAAEFIVPWSLGGLFQGVVKIYPSISCSDPTSDKIRIDYRPLTEDETKLSYYHAGLSHWEGSIELLTPISDYYAGRTHQFRVRIINSGPQTWPNVGFKPVAFAYHWRDETGAMLLHDGLRTPLPHELEPGMSLEMFVSVMAPNHIGKAILDLSLVQEGVRWFDNNGCLPVSVPVEILP